MSLGGAGCWHGVLCSPCCLRLSSGSPDPGAVLAASGLSALRHPIFEGFAAYPHDAPLTLQSRCGWGESGQLKRSGRGAERARREDPAEGSSLESDHRLSPGLLETTVQKVARVKAPNKSLPSAVYCIEDKM